MHVTVRPVERWFEGHILKIKVVGIKYSGGDRGGVTPVPIPNTEVKPSIVDGTARETGWESRTLPD